MQTHRLACANRKLQNIMLMPATDPNRNDHDKTSTPLEPTPTEPTLSPAEQQLFQFLRAGLSVEQIAQRRCRSLATVRNQLSALYRKLGVNTRAKAIALTAKWVRDKESNQ
jgi:DNA-binding NarL/FixJ family response regulator